MNDSTQLSRTEYFILNIAAAITKTNNQLILKQVGMAGACGKVTEHFATSMTSGDLNAITSVVEPALKVEREQVAEELELKREQLDEFKTRTLTEENRDMRTEMESLRTNSTLRALGIAVVTGILGLAFGMMVGAGM